MAITPTNSPVALGAAVLAARKKLGRTQPQLALAAGVGARFIVELEAGKPSPMVKLADGTEEKHKVVDTKDQKELNNLADWILAQ